MRNLKTVDLTSDQYAFPRREGKRTVLVGHSNTPHGPLYYIKESKFLSPLKSHFPERIYQDKF